MKRLRTESEVVDLVSEELCEQEAQKEPQRKPALVRDVATCVHTDLVAVGMLSPHTLLAWHQTCYAWWRQWCDPIYLATLLERALSLAQQHRQREPRVARHLSDCLTLDSLLLALRIGESMWQHLIPTWPQPQSLTTMINTNYYTDSLSIRMVLERVGCPSTVARIKTHKGITLPERLYRIVWRAGVYLELRHDWRVAAMHRKVEEGTGKLKQTVEKRIPCGEAIEWEDRPLLSLAAHLYRTSGAK